MGWATERLNSSITTSKIRLNITHTGSVGRIVAVEELLSGGTSGHAVEIA
jgi:hypothetical protein